MKNWITFQELLEKFEINEQTAASMVHDDNIIAYDSNTLAPLDWNTVIQQDIDTKKLYSRVSKNELVTVSPLAKHCSRNEIYKILRILDKHAVNGEPVVDQIELKRAWLAVDLIPSSESGKKRYKIVISPRQHDDIVSPWGVNQEIVVLKNSLFIEEDIQDFFKSTSDQKPEESKDSKEKEDSGKASNKALLKFIGALLEIHYKSSNYRREDKTPNANSITISFYEDCATNGIDTEGINESTVRKNIIPDAHKSIKPNLPRKSSTKEND